MPSLKPFGGSLDVNCTSLRPHSVVKELVQQSGDKDESKRMVLSGTTVVWRQEVSDSSHKLANDREEDS